MQSGIESLIKLFLVTVLVLAGLAIWLAPKTRWVTARRVSEGLFTVTSIVGMVCGVAGLVATFAWPQQVLEWHLWELTVMPFVLVNAYWFIIVRKARTADILDEKQNFDMERAGSLTWAVSIPAMCAAFVLHEEGLFDAALWFPYFLFVTLLFYSATTLYQFKRK
jgi:hypothetical protein